MSASLSPRFPAAGTRPTRQRLDDLEALLQRMLELPPSQAEAKASPAPDETPQPDRPNLVLHVPPVSSYAAPQEPSNPPAEAVANPVADRSEAKADPALRGQESLPAMLTKTAAAPTNNVESTPTMAALSAAAAPPAVTAPATHARAKVERTNEAGAQEDWVPFSSNWRPSSQTWAPLRETWQKTRTADSSATAQPRNPAAASANAAESAETGRYSPSTLPANLSKVETVDKQVTAAAPPPAVDLPPVPMWLWPSLWLNVGFDSLVLPLGAPGRWLRGRGGKDLLGLTGILAMAAAAGLMVADWYGRTW